MVRPKEIEQKTMSQEKRKSAKNDYFAFYVGRPLSYILTIPFLYTEITPNAVSLISIAPLVLGFIVMYFAKSTVVMLLGWGCFFLWNLLDGVDGNIARYKKQFSPLGSVYDAMSGYVAMVLSFFAWGVAAAHNGGVLDAILPITADIYVILGALSGVFQIFPRFIMHKAITTLGDENKVSSVKDKSEYSSIKLFALNITSVAGFLQVIMLLAIVLNMMDVFTLGYFLLNMLVMVASLRSIFKAE